MIRAENNLRWLMGVANTDGNVIRPLDEPTQAEIHFDWHGSLDEALCLRTELRQQKWEIKKRQLAIGHAKNNLLPSLNAIALYRFLGLGDNLANYENNAPDFPLPDSGALNQFAEGDQQEFRVGVEFGMPVGYRRELANVRNAQVKLAEEVAKMEDFELEVARELGEALHVLDLHYQLAVEYLNRFKNASAEVDAEFTQFKAKGDNFTRLVDAKRRRSDAEIAFYQSLCEYNKVIALIHRRKGTIMEFNSVAMAEGPWPGKAYHDAAENARRRSSSRAMNYGFTRPQVISTGNTPVCGSCGGGGCDACNSMPTEFHDDMHTIPGEVIYEGPVGTPYYQTPSSPESLPTPAPSVLPAPSNNDSSSHRPQVPSSRGPSSRGPSSRASQQVGTAQPFTNPGQVAQTRNPSNNRQVIQAAHSQPVEQQLNAVISQTTSLMASPQQFDVAQIPAHDTRLHRLPSNAAQATATIRVPVQSPPGNQVPGSTSRTPMVVGSGLVQPPSSNPNNGNQAVIRQVNYEQ